MIDRILRALGFRVRYVCDWGEYRYRYDDIDAHMSRPIHKGMSVAPPWARRVIDRSPTHNPDRKEAGE